MNTSKISGMQELLPGPQAIFNQLKQQISEVYHLHGFINIETPTIDRTEILFAKAGGDTEKQIYKVVKTAETAEDADQALRFDHTVPLARYVVEYESNLSFPFRVTQIGRNFRGERAQKGRFREFYQCDIDVIGRNELPISYDAEVIDTLVEALRRFLQPKLAIRISNRKILSGLLEALNLSEKSKDLFSIIDHAEKVPPEKTATALDEIGLSSEQKDIINRFISIRGSREEVIASLRELQALNIENETFRTGIEELDEVLRILENNGLGDSVIGDMLIVRGLDYYTGTVFEGILPEYRQIGAVCSGGRYENLAEFYTDQKLPGVGGSIGLSRLFYVLNEEGLLPEMEEKPIDVAVIPISRTEEGVAQGLAKKLRELGRTTDVILVDKRLGDKMNHAAKIARYGVVVGENEAKTGEFKIKDFKTGEQKALEL